jgi:predicted PurR-regulated permease PerM
MTTTPEIQGIAVDTRKLNTVFLGILVLAAMVFALMELFDVFLPLVLAGLLSLAFKPLVAFLRGHRVPMGLTVLVVLLCGASLLAIFGLVFTSGVQSMIDAAPRYQQSVDRLYSGADRTVHDLMRRSGTPESSLNLRDSLQFSTITSFLASWAGSALSVIANAVLTLLFFIFLVTGSEEFPEKIRRAFSSEQSSRVSQIILQINQQVRSYIVTKTIINIVVSIITAVVLLLFGVDFSLFIAIVTFFLCFIPNFGSFIATVFPAVVSLLQFESFGLSISIVLILIVLHNIVGNFIEPKMMGSSLNLSPLIVLLSLLFWGWVWGVWGMILAVPVTSIIKIVCENVIPLRPLAVLMGSGAPPEAGQKAE